MSAMADHQEETSVDREKKCPLLLRVFINPAGRHHHLAEYQRGQVPSKEVQIYTWMDATLKELTALVKEVNAEARKPGTRFEFALVFPDLRSPNFRMRDIGSTVNGRKEQDDSKTLAQARFHIGDFLDVAICSGSPMAAANDHRGRPEHHRSGGSGSGGGGGQMRPPRYNGDRDFAAGDRRIRPY